MTKEKTYEQIDDQIDLEIYDAVMLEAYKIQECLRAAREVYGEYLDEQELTFGDTPTERDQSLDRVNAIALAMFAKI